MSEDVWSAADTTPDAIEAALRELLRERHSQDQMMAPARVLNLIVVVDRAWKGEIANRLERVGRYHASRTILCAVEDDRDTLDAVVAIGFNEATSGDIKVMREMVEIDMGPQHLQGLETILDPVLVRELQTMLWCPHGHHEAIDALKGIFDVMLLDSDDRDEGVSGLEEAQQLLENAYVVDLAWLRTTPWRERLASSFDPIDRRAALDGLHGLSIRHKSGARASALLLTGWLCSRLGWRPGSLSSANGACLHGVAHRGETHIDIALEPHDQDVPGLAGVTVTAKGGFALSLDRDQGGLRAHEEADGQIREWKILWASRGEGGILGEGVRQALLRDPCYGPSLEAAQEFCL